MVQSTRAQSGEVGAPVPIEIDPPSPTIPSTAPTTAKDAPASPDPWHGNFLGENFLFVFPIALFIIFAVFAAVLSSQS